MDWTFPPVGCKYVHVLYSVHRYLPTSQPSLGQLQGAGRTRGERRESTEQRPVFASPFGHPLNCPKATLPYPAVPGSSHTHRRGPSRLGRHGLSTRPSTHATGTAASFAPSLQAVPCSSREEARAVSIICRLLSRAIQHHRFLLQSCLSAQLMRFTVRPPGCFSSVQQMRQCHFEARITRTKDGKTHATL